ncbi:myb-related transcription factor, partner of profilin-like [Ambystoma mexicanum]|uniref:myb-related transcription factor, partner of profilin-like n=1 Tax=Ambystoma mexicanum TaxID=8296 RepID=UPI0037E834FF
MPKAPKKSEDQLRKRRFSPEELQAMVNHLAEHADVVFSTNMRRESIMRKKNIWEQTAQRVSAVGTTPRTPRDCHKRWDDLRVWVRSLLSTNRSKAMQTGGSPSSPLRLEPWEETCGSLIGTESIEGIGDMECGATSSADGGTDHDSGEAQTSRPNTSMGSGRVQRIPAPKKTPTPAPERSVEAAPPQSLPASAPATMATPTSAESSIAGEVAATGPEEIVVDSPSSICGASEEEFHPTVYTPEPSNVPLASCSDFGDPATPGRSAPTDTQGYDDRGPSSPVESMPEHVGPRHLSDEFPSFGTRRATQLTDLITEFMEDNREARVEWLNELCEMRQTVTESTTRLCDVLGCIADALEAAHSNPQHLQEDTATSSRDTPASPLRRILRSMRRRDMPPPAPGSME